MKARSVKLLTILLCVLIAIVVVATAIQLYANRVFSHEWLLVSLPLKKEANFSASWKSGWGGLHSTILYGIKTNTQSLKTGPNRQPITKTKWEFSFFQDGIRFQDIELAWSTAAQEICTRNLQKLEIGYRSLVFPPSVAITLLLLRRDVRLQFLSLIGFRKAQRGFKVS